MSSGTSNNVGNLTLLYLNRLKKPVEKSSENDREREKEKERAERTERSDEN